MRPQDGAIVAMVGSADFNNKDIDGQFNVTLAARQPGSSIKPFIYLTAFERDGNGNYFTPSTILWDVPSPRGLFFCGNNLPARAWTGFRFRHRNSRIWRKA